MRLQLTIAIFYNSIKLNVVQKGENIMKSEATKELIIEKTTELINELEGKVEEITIRKIAKRANIGVGLIHHYFFSKENLIEICIQQIINKVVYSFQVEGFEQLEPLARTKLVTKQVVRFLMENQSISKVSILDDMKNPKDKDNTFGTVIGLAYCMSPTKEEYEMYLKKAFYLVSILQVSFLRKDMLQEVVGINYYDEQKRDRFLEELVDMIMGGCV